MKNYFKRTRHHLHAGVGITGGFLACLSLSWVWIGFRNLEALDKVMWFLASSFYYRFDLGMETGKNQ
jgi:hypothetical protein